MNKIIMILLLAVTTLIASCTNEDWNRIDRKTKNMKLEVPLYEQR